ncbi:subtilisin-like protease SBT1.3 [Heracleum sosnowskyi]|uniref:Subtilisin-like protease SBT1.3 n=1 Tax=Heracleum sosnowskyi TaxID=360622 RepID=A0AAD8HFV8_9APIA|nr:subtilisin-like protease SBT1.3 [Heracleum sosnowskyi]
MVVKWALFLLSSYLTIISVLSSTKIPTSKTYIVQIDRSSKPETFGDHVEWYASVIQSVALQEDDTSDSKRIMYNYQTAFHGVAARLSLDEVQRLQQHPDVIAVYPEVAYELHTTRSPFFLGLASEDNKYVWSQNLAGHDVVVGVVDTGIWPECKSFNDSGLPPVPDHWKGACETGRGFDRTHCNRKIVGARMYYHGYEANVGKINEKKVYKSPRDQDGHGTHTAATVAGAPVIGADLLGYAQGTARGMAPGARIAVYKVCWAARCLISDIIAALDQAVTDGVNVLSISLGSSTSSYQTDSLSIATFGAMEKGVFISMAAGNSGPTPDSLANASPWVTTVGASTMDRDFPSTVKLGTGRKITGASLYKGRKKLSPRKQYPLVYTGSNSSIPDLSSLCSKDTLNPKVVSGKIVICNRGITNRVEIGQVVKNAGGVGMILANTAENGEELIADCYLLPAVNVGEKAGAEIKQYAMTHSHPTATLSFHGTRLGIKPSPVVASFSSRGPNYLNLEVLKPDIIAPGVNILAAWPRAVSPSSLATDKRIVDFNVLSGTSMSCPHVSGIAALIKARHPDWSPSAIKSALMTTAYIHDNKYDPLGDASTSAPSTPYAHGAGHVNPRKALNPGLIYDLGPQDYFEFLCAQISADDMVVFARLSNRTCQYTLTSLGDLNYPALSVSFLEKGNHSVLTLHRTVTNVGKAVSNYQAVVSSFKSVVVKVEPTTLHFTKKHQKLSYRVTILNKKRQAGPEFGHLIWKNKSNKIQNSILLFCFCFSAKSGKSRDYSWKIYTLKELVHATNNFDNDNKIAEGFENSYWGRTSDGVEIAVHRLKPLSTLAELKFAVEVEILGRVKHKNVLCLKGFYAGGDERLIVHDYMPNHSLITHLHGQLASDCLLDWPRRISIAIGLSEGISYLHHEANPHIIHRDIKASNVLLDSEFQAKLASFGVAKLVPEGVTHMTTRVKGTLGYIAPEYAMWGKVSKSCDVYSFGILLLEIISAKKPLEKLPGGVKRHIVEWASPLVQKGAYELLVDPRLKGECDRAQLESLIIIAMRCTNSNPENRPSMIVVVAFLKGENVGGRRKEIKVVRDTVDGNEDEDFGDEDTDHEVQSAYGNLAPRSVNG